MRTRIFAIMLCLFTLSANADITEMFKIIEDAIGDRAAKQEIEKVTSTYEMKLGAVEVGPNGIEANCKTLNERARNDSFNIKSTEWTQEIVDFLKNKTESCAQQKIAATDTEKYPYENDSERRNAEWTISSINKHYENALSEREQKRKSAENFKIMQAVAECKKLDSYEMYVNENMVVNFQQAVNDYKAIQKKERQIANESGIRNLATERKIAEKLIFYRDLRDAHFKQYKRFGGTVSVAEKVMRVTENPCK